MRPTLALQMGKQTKGGKVTCPRSQRQELQSMGSNPGLPNPAPALLVPRPAANQLTVLFDDGSGGVDGWCLSPWRMEFQSATWSSAFATLGKQRVIKGIYFSNERHLWKSNILLCQPLESGEEGWKDMLWASLPLTSWSKCVQVVQPLQAPLESSCMLKKFQYRGMGQTQQLKCRLCTQATRTPTMKTSLSP